jgi:triacylglycerol lipase
MSPKSKAVQPPNVLNYGLFVSAAYAVFAAHPNNLNPLQSMYPSFPVGYELIVNIQMKDFFGGTTSTKYYGFMARNLVTKEYVVAFRGTITMEEWWDDLHIKLVKCPYLGNAGRVAEGFLDIYKTMSWMVPGQSDKPKAVKNKLALPDGKTMDSSISFVITGHSLGSALATFYAADVVAANPKVYTLASPRVGDTEFVNAFNSAITTSYRIYNKPDIVPKLPPDIPGVLDYKHVKGGYEVDSLNYMQVKQDLGCYHSHFTYLFLLGANVNVLGSCRT